MPFIGDTGQLSNIYEKNHETTTLRVVEGDAAYQAYNPADSHYKLITTLQEITDIGNVTSNTVQFSNAITGFTTTSNVGIANSTPTHTLDVGSKAYIDENASNTFWTSGTLYADKVLSETTEITNSVTTRDVLADKFFPKTNGFIEVTSNVGVLNTAPVHTLDIGANVQIDEYGSNTFWTSGNVYSEHHKGSNVTVSGSVDTDQLIVNDINSKDTDFVNFTSNVGVLNTAPVHTLDIGANVQIDEYGSNTFWTSGNVHADKYTGSEIQLSGVIRATDFILTGGSEATPTPDLQTISEVLASGGGVPFSSDRTLTLSNVTTALDASVIQSITTKSNVIGNNVTVVTVNSNLIGNNVTAVTVNSNLIGNNVTAVTVNSNLIGNNVTAVTVNSNLIGNNVTAVTVNSNLIGNNVTAVTVNSNLIGNNVTAVTVNSNVIGNNVTAVTVNSNLIGNNVTAVTVNSNLIGNNVTAVTVNSNVIGNNVSASFISGNGDLIFRKYSFGVNGVSAYTIIGPGFTTAANNPTLTLLRGQVYVFDNSTYYGSHPLQIRTSRGGTAYTNGVVDNGGGKLTFTVPMNAPIKLYYQCTNHSDMGNIIYIPLENLDTSQTLNLSNDLVVNTDDLVVDTVNSKVGIGTGAPAYTLDVAGDINLSGDFYQGGSLFVSSLWTDGTDSLYYRSNVEVGTANLFVDTVTSNVGVGTSTPAYTLDVHGTANVGALTATSVSGDGSGLTSLNGTQVTSGTVAAGRIANLNASKITAGTFDTNRIPNLDAGKITTGTLGTNRIPNLDAGKITTGTLDRPISTTTGTFSGDVVTGNTLYVGTNTNDETAKTIYFGGTYGDNLYDHCVIERRVWSTSTEKQELLLFSGNDGESAAGPDRIRLKGGQILFDTLNSSTDRTTENTKMIIRADGDVGIGTTSPGYKLDVNGTLHAADSYFDNVYIGGSTSRGLRSVSSNYGTVQTTGGASISEGYSIDGRYVFMSENDNSCGIFNDLDDEWMINCVRNSSVRLYFNAAEKLATASGGVSVTGQVYASGAFYTDGNRSVIRGGSPTLYFRDTDSNSAMIHNNGNQLYILRGGNDSESWTQVNGQWPWIFNLTNNDSTCGGSLYCVGNVTAYSDIRHKKDIVKLDDALEKVEKLNGYTYTRKDDGKRYTGLIAQEVLEVLPEAVIADEKGDYSLAYGNMVGLLIEAIKELKLEIDELKKSR